MKLGHRLHWISDNLKQAWPFQPDFNDYVHHLPIRSADRIATGREVELWQQSMDHPLYDDYWRSRSTWEHLSEVRTPAFIVAGWYDNYVEGDLDAFAYLSRRSSAHRLLVGPWPHNQTAPYPSGITFGPDAFAPTRQYQLDWFNYWMRGQHPAPEFRFPRVRIFVMGINQWRDEDEWPLSRARLTSWYLDSNKGANTLTGDGRLSVERPTRDDLDTYVYDPRKPAPTAGGALCCDPKVMPWGPMDQRAVEARDDVLVYTSAALRQDLEVTGTVRVQLWVSTSAPDTDFTAKLVDVFPNGHARNLCDGMLRLRYREGLDRVRLARSGEVYPVTFDVGVTSNVFKAGHRVRLDISSSNFPRFDRNPNTGRPVADENELRTARQTVHHSPCAALADYSSGGPVMGRPCEFDRQHAIETAMQLFLDKGYEATSVEDLTTALNISRASLYNAFGDKHGLLLETFECAAKAGKEVRLAALDSPGPVRDVLRRFFYGLASETRGCFFLTLGAELSSQDKEVRRRVKQSIEATRKKFRALVEAAKANGEIETGVDAESAAAVLLGALVSLLTLNRVHPDRDVTAAVIEQALKTLDRK